MLPCTNSCTAEKLTVIVMDPITFKNISTEFSLELNDTLVDIKVERLGDVTYLVLGQTNFGVRIYTFDGQNFTLHQTLETKKISAIDVVVTSASRFNKTLILAVASYGLDTLSTIWTLKVGDGAEMFQLLQDVISISKFHLMKPFWRRIFFILAVSNFRRY